MGGEQERPRALIGWNALAILASAEQAWPPMALKFEFRVVGCANNVPGKVVGEAPELALHDNE